MPDFKKGDLVVWERWQQPPGRLGLMIGFYDYDTREELESQYDASNVLVEAAVLFAEPLGLQHVLLHELQLYEEVNKNNGQDLTCR